jgi:hypothetical protein
VELPALPHPSILRPLVSALRGEQIAAKNIPSISVSSQEDEGCNFCHQSGWKCVYLTHDHYCNRHSPHNLVTITAHTLEGYVAPNRCSLSLVDNLSLIELEDRFVLVKAIAIENMTCILYDMITMHSYSGAIAKSKDRLIGAWL